MTVVVLFSQRLQNACNIFSEPISILSLLSTAESIADTTNSANQVPKIHRIHFSSKNFIVCNKKIISRQINTLKKCACAKHYGDISLLKQIFYTGTYGSRQIPNMISYTLLYHAGEIIISVHFLHNIF